MKPAFVLFYILLVTLNVSAQEYKRANGGTVFISRITDNHVNVRAYPSLKGKTVTQVNVDDQVIVTGMSKEVETIGNYKGYWLRINLITDKELANYPLGWVYSQYVRDSSHFVPSTMEIVQISSTEEDNYKLVIKVGRGENYSQLDIYPLHESGQNFYHFTWFDDSEKFYFTDVPGTYVWYPGTKKLLHMIYEGLEVEAGWPTFTDDLKYMFQDFGTSPGVRGLGVWSIASGEKIFSGHYYDTIMHTNHYVEVVYDYEPWNIENGQIDKETEQHAIGYISDHPKPEESTLRKTLLVVYRFDLDKRLRAYQECRWVGIQ